jgi:hypothetical protein
MQRWVYKAHCEGKDYEYDMELPTGADPKDHDVHLRPYVDKFSKAILADLGLTEGKVKCSAGCEKAAKGLMHRPLCYPKPVPPVYSDAPDAVCGDSVCVEKMNQAFKQAWDNSKPDGCCAACLKTESEKGTPLLRCSRCKTTHYCSLQCQRTHWPTHKKACTKHQEDGEEGEKAHTEAEAPPVEVPQGSL